MLYQFKTAKAYNPVTQTKHELEHLSWDVSFILFIFHDCTVKEACVKNYRHIIFKLFENPLGVQCGSWRIINLGQKFINFYLILFYSLCRYSFSLGTICVYLIMYCGVKS